MTSTRVQLETALQANNTAYRTCEITREQWIAKNRELNELGKPLGLELPEFALTERIAR